MKHAFTLGKTSLLAFLLILSAVVACKDDDPEPTPVDNNPIVATWQLTAIAPTASGTTIPDLSQLIPCIYSLKLTFKSDNTLATADCPIAVATIDTYVPFTGSKWKVDGDNLILTNEGKNVTKSFKFTQTATELKVFVDDIVVVPGSPAIDAVLNFKKI